MAGDDGVGTDYTADGLRVAQSVGVSQSVFFWDTASALPQALAISDGALYLYGLGLVAQQQSDAWQYPLGDALGSVRLWTDDEGTVTYAAGYTPFGEELWREGSTTSAWGYTGEWQDPDVGLLYLRARWYDGTTGRFTQVDPSRLEHNPYLYAQASPTMATDPTGKCTYHPDDDPGTCRVDPGDWLLYIADQYAISPRTLIQDWNPEYRNTNPPWLIHAGNLVYLYDRGNPPAPPADGPYHLDNATGYLEGTGVNLIIGGAVLWASGREQVYDFVTKQSAEYTFEGRHILGPICGFSTNIFALGASDYVGVFHFPPDPEHDIDEIYGGTSLVVSIAIGEGLTIPEVDIGVGGVELAAFVTTDGNPMFGIPTVADISQPFYGASISLGVSKSRGLRVPLVAGVTQMFLNFDEVPDTSKQYISPAEMAEEIRSGAPTSPLSWVGSAASPARNWAADHLMWMWTP